MIAQSLIYLVQAKIEGRWKTLKIYRDSEFANEVWLRLIASYHTDGITYRVRCAKLRRQV